MDANDLEHGSYYTIRGAENLWLCAWLRDDGVWVLEEVEKRRGFIVHNDKLLRCTHFDSKTGNPSSWTMADVVPDYPGARDDATARDLLRDVDI